MILSTGRRACRDATMVGKLNGAAIFRWIRRKPHPGYYMSLTGAPYRIGGIPSRKLMVRVMAGFNIPFAQLFFFTLACMSEEVTKWLVNVLFHLLINGLYWAYNPLIQTIS